MLRFPKRSTSIVAEVCNSHFPSRLTVIRDQLVVDMRSTCVELCGSAFDFVHTPVLSNATFGDSAISFTPLF